MPRSQIPLTLAPDRCDKCRRCVAACPYDALKIGPTYILVEWRSCDGCGICAKTCTTGAITSRTASKAPPRPAPVKRAARTKAASGPGAASGTKAAPRTKASTTSEPPAWTLPEAYVLIVVMVAAIIGKDAVLASEIVAVLDPDTAVFARVGALFAFYAVTALALAALAWRRGVPVPDALGLRSSGVAWRAQTASVGLVFAALVATRLFALAYGLSAQAIGWDPPAREMSDLTEVFGPTVWGLLFSVALVVVVAPVVEEVVYRGVLQTALMRRIGSWPAIAVAAGLFALGHATPWLLLPLFVLGMACGWLAHTRASLLPAIWLHAAYNALPVAVAFYLVW